MLRIWRVEVARPWMVVATLDPCWELQGENCPNGVDTEQRHSPTRQEVVVSMSVCSAVACPATAPPTAAEPLLSFVVTALRFSRSSGFGRHPPQRRHAGGHRRCGEQRGGAGFGVHHHHGAGDDDGVPDARVARGPARGARRAGSDSHRLDGKGSARCARSHGMRAMRPDHRGRRSCRAASRRYLADARLRWSTLHAAWRSIRLRSVRPALGVHGLGYGLRLPAGIMRDRLQTFLSIPKGRRRHAL